MTRFHFYDSNDALMWCSFSVHAIQMGEKVTSVFEYAIKALSRKEDLSISRYVLVPASF